MLVRMLIAASMAAGPIPVRVCTCATAGPSAVTGRVEHRSHSDGCCDSGHCAPPTKAAADATHSHPAAGTPGHPDRHDRNCPVVNPRPTASAAAPTPAVVCPDDADAGVPAWGGASIAGRPLLPRGPHPQPARHAIPLDLALVALRI